MKFAFVEGSKLQPQPKLHGTCPLCDGDMIAKCGRVKVWHWALKGKRHCDQWWENETEWHRNWKDEFPTDWQEVSQKDEETGEKHIADVKTPHGLVIEFQHSPIHMGELRTREEFYGNMIWIVDGMRGDLDKNYFNMGLSGQIQTDPLTYQVTWWGQGKLLQNWSDARAMVFLDFGEEILWRLLLFDAETKVGAVGPLPRKTLIRDCLNGVEISVTKLDEKEIGSSN